MGLGTGRFAASPSWSDLRTRLVSALVLGAAVVLLTAWGGLPFRLLCSASGIVVFEEWARMTGAKTARRSFRLARLSYLAALAAFLFGADRLALLVPAVAGLAVLWVGRGEARKGWVAAGLAYAAAAALAPGLLRGHEPAGLAALGFVIAVVWSTDIFAYFAGRSLGGPKLMPAVSPKKTVSGALGGLAAGVLFGSVFHLWVTGGFRPAIVLLAAVLSVLGQGGDLFESWVKRRFGVKDSGRIIPGHGGLMDRVDALIVAIAAAWLVGLAMAGFAHPARALFPI